MAATVAAELHGAHFSVPAYINGRPARMLLDTGASETVVSVEAARRLGLLAADGAVSGSGAAGQYTASATTLSELTIGAIRQRQQQAYIVPMPAEFTYDGVLGAPFFMEYVVTLDYKERLLTIQQPEMFIPPPGVSAVNIRLEGKKPLVQASAAGVSGWYSVDTGAGNALTFFTPAVERNGLRTALSPRLRTVTGVSPGGPVRGDLVRVPDVTIGPHVFHNVLAELSLAEQGMFASPLFEGNLGGELWHRFIVTLDYSRGQLYLRPNESFGMPFAGPRAGFTPSIVRGEVEVIDVLADSPAEQAGVSAGDVLLAVNGTALDASSQGAVSATLDSIYAALRADAGSSMTLTLRDIAGATRDVTFTLRELL
jgi:clan AA aspartic protease (TIGR02281 family)